MYHLRGNAYGRRNNAWSFWTKIWMGLMVSQYALLFIGLASYGSLYVFTEPKGNPHHPQVWMNHVKRNIMYSINEYDQHHFSQFAKRDSNSTNMSPVNDNPLMDGDTKLTCPDKTTDECLERKTQLTVWLLAFFLGMLGVGRFYAGYICCGVAKLCTCGGCGIWALVDWILILTLTFCRDFDGCAFERNM